MRAAGASSWPHNRGEHSREPAAPTPPSGGLSHLLIPPRPLRFAALSARRAGRGTNTWVEGRRAAAAQVGGGRELAKSALNRSWLSWPPNGVARPPCFASRLLRRRRAGSRHGRAGAAP